MHWRTLLVGSLPLSLLLSIPGVAVSPASDYQANITSLRALWATDIESGLPSAQLLPLQTELNAFDSATFVGVPLIVLNPSRLQSEVSSLRTRTEAIYSLELDSSRTSASVARLTLTRALIPISPLQSHLLREDFAAAITINDYSSLAATWSLDALLIPLDRSLSARQLTLASLTAQSNALALPISTAIALDANLTTYFTSTPTARYAAAPGLILLADTTLAHLQGSIDAELARRAEAARVAAQEAAQVAAAYAYAHPPGLYLYLNHIYSDCTGVAVVPPGLSRNPCIASLWLIAHKWSTGASFFALHIGSHVYYQGRTYTVYNIFIADPANEYFGVNGLANENAPMRLETCYTDSGSLHLIIQAR